MDGRVLNGGGVLAGGGYGVYLREAAVALGGEDLRDIMATGGGGCQGQGRAAG